MTDPARLSELKAAAEDGEPGAMGEYIAALETANIELNDRIREHALAEGEWKARFDRLLSVVEELARS